MVDFDFFFLLLRRDRAHAIDLAGQNLSKHWQACSSVWDSLCHKRGFCFVMECQPYRAKKNNIERQTKMSVGGLQFVAIKIGGITDLSLRAFNQFTADAFVLCD